MTPKLEPGGPKAGQDVAGPDLSGSAADPVCSRRMAESETNRPAAPEPFFLCGFGKSGTNWVGNLLNLHPAIRCEGEFHFQHFFAALDEFTKYPWQVGSREAVRTLAREGVERLVRESLATLAHGRPGVRLVGDRSPRPLRELVRGAKTIYVYRDGRDVVVSYTFHHLRVGEAHHFPERLRASFVRHQAAFREDPGVMGRERPGLLGDEAWVRETARFWAWRILADLKQGATVDSATLLNQRYEDLHADLAGQCRRMYAFLGVDHGLARAPSVEGRTAAGFGREDRQSFFRRGEVGDWRRFATPEFCRWLREEAGEALARLGYGWEAQRPDGARQEVPV
ncbi:MAG: sulfotransferase domain-containing protein [Phycisphaerales bacterium]|nr:sulfotransferase domain-containing protein [Phycisphaerales bacterium]